MANVLKKSDKFITPAGPVLTIVMDGVGLTAPTEGNAVAKAAPYTATVRVPVCLFRLTATPRRTKRTRR